MNWYEEHFGNDFEAFIGWFIVGVLVFMGSLFYFIIPKYHYAHASSSEKCQIDLKKMHDEDKFCNYNDDVKSHKAIVAEEAKAKEETRRAALTPQQRCEEDNKSFSDPESGDSFIVLCKADGTHEVKSADEMQDELHQDEAEANDCNPNYSPCVPNSYYDLDCPDVGFTVRVVGTDVYRFDADGDGYGCESY
jgi:hypothetical protein